MIAQALCHRSSAGANQRPYVGHPAAPLIAKETTIALYKLNKEALDLELEVRRHQIHSVPGSEIEGTEVEPDILALGPINRAHMQRLGTMVKKARIAEISDQ